MRQCNGDEIKGWESDVGKKGERDLTFWRKWRRGRGEENMGKREWNKEEERCSQTQGVEKEEEGKKGKMKGRGRLKKGEDERKETGIRERKRKGGLCL
jgi:hypothetical protein